MSINLYLGLAFLSATVATTFLKGNIKDELLLQLTPEEQKIHQEIVEMRRNIYLQGLFIGLVLSVLYLKVNPSENIYTNGLTAVAITGVVNYFYYILKPKNKYMLEYLDTQKENKAWLKIYKHMKFVYHSAFLGGLSSASFISNNLI